MPVLTTANQAAADAPQNVPLTLVYLDVAGDPAWAWSGHGDLTMTVANDPLLAGGATFLGVGDIGSIGQITHAADGSIQNMQISLGRVDMTTGEPAAFANNVASWSHRRAVVWRAFGRTDASGGVLIDPPFRLMTARMVHVGIINGREPSLAVKLASKAATDGQRASGWKMADAHQQRFWPGDTAFAFIPLLMQLELRFGVRSNIPSVGGGGRGIIPGVTESVRPQ